MRSAEVEYLPYPMLLLRPTATAIRSMSRLRTVSGKQLLLLAIASNSRQPAVHWLRTALYLGYSTLMSKAKTPWPMQLLANIFCT